MVPLLMLLEKWIHGILIKIEKKEAELEKDCMKNRFSSFKNYVPSHPTLAVVPSSFSKTIKLHLLRGGSSCAVRWLGQRRHTALCRTYLVLSARQRSFFCSAWRRTTRRFTCSFSDINHSSGPLTGDPLLRRPDVLLSCCLGSVWCFGCCGQGLARPVAARAPTGGRWLQWPTRQS